MNNELIEKNKIYQEQINEIAKFIFYAFHYEEDEQPELNITVENEKEVKKWLEKAEKILAFFDTCDEAKKAFRFLNTVNPMYAKEIIDGL